MTDADIAGLIQKLRRAGEILFASGGKSICNEAANALAALEAESTAGWKKAEDNALTIENLKAEIKRLVKERDNWRLDADCNMKKYPFPQNQKFYAGDLVVIDKGPEIGAFRKGRVAFVRGSYIELHGHIPSPDQMKFHSNYEYQCNSFGLECEEHGHTAWHQADTLRLLRQGLKHRHVLGHGL